MACSELMIFIILCVYTFSFLLLCLWSGQENAGLAGGNASNTIIMTENIDLQQPEAVMESLFETWE